MSTVDLNEVRRNAERYVTRVAVGAATLLDADALLAYLPMLLDELEQLRQQQRLNDRAGTGRDLLAVGDAQ